MKSTFTYRRAVLKDVPLLVEKDIQRMRENETWGRKCWLFSITKRANGFCGVWKRVHSLFFLPLTETPLREWAAWKIFTMMNGVNSLRMGNQTMTPAFLAFTPNHATAIKGSCIRFSVWFCRSKGTKSETDANIRRLCGISKPTANKAL